MFMMYAISLSFPNNIDFNHQMDILCIIKSKFYADFPVTRFKYFSYPFSATLEKRSAEKYKSHVYKILK